MRVSDSDANRAHWRRYWDRSAATYDRPMMMLDRALFRDTRAWVCGQAEGQVLEVAVGTGLNLAHYPPAVELTGSDLSQAMLTLARDRSAAMGREITLQAGDAERLAFPDSSFDRVVCTFGLCAIPDARQAIAEMVRVLRPGGLLLLGDHVASSNTLVRGAQRLMEVVSVPVGGEHFRRRPVALLQAQGLAVHRQQRFALGLVERVAARKPATPSVPATPPVPPL